VGSLKSKVVILFFIPILFLVSLLLFDVKNIGLANGHSHAVYGIDTKQKVVALTFDDGPDPRFTPEVLDILKQYHSKVTFFVVGKNARSYPDLIRQINREGHEIGNHTMTHPEVDTLTQDEILAEIQDCSKIITGLTGRPPIYFRPPKGITNHFTEKDAANLDMRQILWSVCIENMSAPTPEAMASRVLKKVKPGSIILLHDGRLDRSKTVKALPLLLEGLKKQGYKVVTVNRLLAIQNEEN